MKDALVTEPGGGVHWELAEARTQIIAAQLAGDADAETIGWMRLADALVNAAASGSAEQLTPMLLGLRAARTEANQARADRRTDAIVSEHNQSMLLDQAEIVQAEQGQHAARLGLAESAILGLALAKAVSKADRAALTAQIAGILQRLAVLEDATHAAPWEPGAADRRHVRGG